MIVTPVIVQPERLAEDRVASVPVVMCAAAQDAGCTLLEWTLTHRYGEGGDYLDLCVECDTGTDETALRNRLITACRQALDMPRVDDRYLSAVGAGAPAATPSE